MVLSWVLCPGSGVLNFGAAAYSCMMCGTQHEFLISHYQSSPSLLGNVNRPVTGHIWGAYFRVTLPISDQAPLTLYFAEGCVFGIALTRVTVPH